MPRSGWLATEASRPTAAQLVTYLAEHLVALGIPLSRLLTGLPTLHPEILVREVRWTPESGAKVTSLPHTLTRSPSYLVSPVVALQQGSVTEIRRRLIGADAVLDFPVLADLAATGVTDYFAIPIAFTDGRRSFISFTTEAPAGFSDAHLELLRDVPAWVPVRLELESMRYAMSSLLEVYLGANAAKRVLDGAFLRGGGEVVNAAIFTCDLRGFTQMSDRLPVRDVVAMLDRYFECVAVPIAEHGGEVLKFIGDAVLAVFTIDGDARAPCRAALAAAEEALSRIGALATSYPEVPIGVGVALHVGEVMYGNVGAPGRLDFTVIGAAVNEVCRVEALSKDLKVPLLVTASFAEACADERLVSLGRHALRGVREEQAILTLASLR
ncbi:MAG: Adenylate cyclase [Myxococcaceae bacterium]|nr:Adenylate cyclase [Myxococcaceae bacterium]